MACATCPSARARAIVQPYIFVLQLVSISLLALSEAGHLWPHLLAPGGDHRFRSLLPCTLCWA